MSEGASITSQQAKALQALIEAEVGIGDTVHVENEFALGSGYLLKVSTSTDPRDKARYWLIGKDGGVLEL